MSDSFARWRTTTDKLLGLPRPLETIQHISLQHVIVHLTYVFGLLPSYHASDVLPDWSLSLEMQFYLLFPLFMLLALRFGWVLFSVASSFIWVAFTLYAGHLGHPFLQPSPLPLSLLWFVIGMVWASAYLAADQRKALAALGLALLSRDPHDIVLVAVFAWVLFSDGKLSLGPSADFIRRALSGQFSSFLARASYSVYLTHLLILTPVAYLLCTRFQLTAGSRFLFAFTATAAVSYGLAKPLEVLENWGIEEGKRISAKLNQCDPAKLVPSRHLEAFRTVARRMYRPASN